MSVQVWSVLYNMSNYIIRETMNEMIGELTFFPLLYAPYTVVIRGLFSSMQEEE